MTLIRDIVHQIIDSGYLSLETEEQLRQLLQSKYDLQDFRAFIELQNVAMKGLVRQESREMKAFSSAIYLREELPRKPSADLPQSQFKKR
jgi:hypothetical protein